MPEFDLPLTALREYRPEVRRPDDLEAFWAETLRESRALARGPEWQATPNPHVVVDRYDVTFSGFGGDPVKAWLIVPAGTNSPLPTVVEYIGYNGGRGLSHVFGAYAYAGYAHLVMDNRGMGAGGVTSDTVDAHADGAPHQPGFMTQGIDDPSRHYLRRLITDAVLALDAARELPFIDGSRIATAGGSMGGGLSLAATALGEGVTTALIDVPFLCHYGRAIRLASDGPYIEIAAYLHRNRDAVERAERTLSYFDGAVLASLASVPALFSVGLMDVVCPPSTVFAAYNAWGGAGSEIAVYGFNGHEGGQEHHELAKYEWLRAHFNHDPGLSDTNATAGASKREIRHPSGLDS